MKKYELYLFDFDGTLFDTLDSLIEVYKLGFLKYGITCKDDEYIEFLGESLLRAFTRKGIPQKDMEDAIKYFNNLANTFKVYRKTKLYKETLKLFKYLNENNIKYGIVTGSSTIRVNGVLDYFKIDKSKMCVLVGSDMVKKPKPNKEPIELALKLTNYLDKKDKVIYIGDAPQDEGCAKDAGVDCVLIDRSKNIDLFYPFK